MGQSSQRRYRRLKEEGFCPRCKNKNDIMGFTYCSICRSKFREGKKKNPIKLIQMRSGGYLKLKKKGKIYTKKQ